LGVCIFIDIQDTALKQNKEKERIKMLFIGEEPKEGQTRLWLQCLTHGLVGITVNVASDSDFKKTYHCPECKKVLEGWPK